MNHETSGLAACAKERQPKVQCPFGKHDYDKSGECACGDMRPKNRRKQGKHLKQIMKTTIVILLMTVACHAGTLADDANIFGPNGAKVSAELSSLPVWIETRVETPGEGLKEYADAKAKTITTNGFVLVITTQTRAWRISMNPIGLASSEATRQAGEAMTAKFKRGQFAEGAIELANKLNNLSRPNKASENLLFLAAAVVVLLFACFLAWRLFTKDSREKNKKESKQREHEERKFDDSNLTNAQRRKAEKLFKQYSPSERERMAVQYPGYYSGCHNDIFFWWWLMSTNNDHCCHGASSSPTYAESPRSAPMATDDSPSYSSPSPSYSDSGGSSGGWDSGGSSSFDSGGSSSSDSSGSSGSW